MIRRSARALMALFTFTLAATAVVAAHPGHEHKVMGAITMAAVSTTVGSTIATGTSDMS